MFDCSIFLTLCSNLDSLSSTLLNSTNDDCHCVYAPGGLCAGLDRRAGRTQGGFAESLEQPEDKRSPVSKYSFDPGDPDLCGRDCFADADVKEHRKRFHRIVYGAFFVCFDIFKKRSLMFGQGGRFGCAPLFLSCFLFKINPVTILNIEIRL